MSPDREANHRLVLIGLAAMLIEWLPGAVGPYGYFIDELYYLACADHLAWGYVDHPPLSIALLAVVRAIGGDGLLVLRFVPGLLAGLTAIVTGLISRRLGAGAFGQALAASAMALAGVPMVLFSFYSMNALDILLWALGFWVLIEIEERDAPRLWLVFGAIVGVGLLNKHTLVLLPAGLVVGLLLTRARRHLIRPWFWGGMALAGLVLLPNLLWQAHHGWPSFEFYVNADRLKNNPTPALEVVLQQIQFMNPLAFPVWLAGLLFLFGRGKNGRLRHLGWVYVLWLLLLAIGHKSRPDRLTPIYPLLFGAGGAAFDLLVQRFRAGWLQPVMIVAVVLGGLVFIPIGIPLLPPPMVAAYGARLGLVPQTERGPGKRSALPQWLSDRLDWNAFVEDVVRVVGSLPAADRSGSVIIAPSYGQAGALERLGRGRGLPQVYGTQNNYALWGPPPEGARTVIVIGYSAELLGKFFGQVERAATHRCSWCTPWRDDMPIWIARQPRGRMADLWSRITHYE